MKPFNPGRKNGGLVAAVQSDIVGYTTMTMEAGKWYMVGTPFVPLADGTTLTVNDIFHSGFSEGDQLYVYYSSQNRYTTPFTWRETESEAGWCSQSSNLATFSLAPGQAVFINKKSGGEVVLAGKVSATEVVSFGSESEASWTQIACVYPTKMKVNDIC